MAKRFLAIIALLLLASIASAQIDTDPGTISELTAVMRYEGTVRSSGVGSAALNVRIPQADIDTIKTTGATGFLFEDSTGNRVLRLVFRDLKEGDFPFSADIVFRNFAKSTPAGLNIDESDTYWLRPSQSVPLTEQVFRRAWPFDDRTLSHAAELALDVAAKEKNAVTLAALLRAAGIPARMAEGYAPRTPGKYERVSWVEIPALDAQLNEHWVPFDPANQRGGWLSAASIPFAYLLDSSQYSTQLEYTGTGSASLVASSVSISPEALRRSLPIAIESAQPAIAFPDNLNGFISVRAKTDGCTLVPIEALSCRDESGRPVLDIMESRKNMWVCGEQGVRWFFSTQRSNFVCPVVVKSPISADASVRVDVNGGAERKQLLIAGPAAAKLGGSIGLEARGVPESAFGSALFYSQQFGSSSAPYWELAISKPGKHTFYLYYDGSLATHAVETTRGKSFILSASSPNSVRFGSELKVRTSVQNLAAEARAVLVRMRVGGNIQSRQVEVPALQSATADFSISPEAVGTLEYFVYTDDPAVEIVSGRVEVTPLRGIETAIAQPTADFLTSFIKLFFGIFGLG